MLLHWGTLVPQGGSCLASVRFAGPVRIHVIRIHPYGASLFAQNPGAVSETEPDSFSLSVFLTAQSTPTIHDPKPKGTNILVPTRLSYSGGLREFPLDMGPDFVTKLMVIQGNFTRVTLAVYGDVISSQPMESPVSYEPIPLPDIPRHPLPTPLNVCDLEDPSLLARSLLTHSSDARPLSLVIRLVCCLRDRNENSAVYLNIEDSIDTDLSGLSWLVKATDTLMVPISEEENLDFLKKLIGRALEVTSMKTQDVLYLIAELLRYASAQPPCVIRTILDTLDMRDILDIDLLDKHILDRLDDAAASHLIARCLRSTSILGTLQALRDDSRNIAIKHSVASLMHRVHGWEQFEKALASPTPDIATVIRWIKEIASDDLTFGVFLLSMVEDESLASELGSHFLEEQVALPISLWNSKALVSLPEFIAFVRAFVGISCVMIVLCWSIHISDTRGTDRILAMIRLWQEVDGYREIVNHVLLVPQMAHQLENVLHNSGSRSPSTTLIHAEQILSSLFSLPETMARRELAVLVNSLSDSPASISEEERLEMMEISMIAEGGPSEAVSAVLKWSNRPVDTSVARALQTALSILEMTLEDRETGEWRIMQAAWQEGLHGLVYSLVDIFHNSVALVRSQFLLNPPPPFGLASLLRLLTSSNTILRILSRLLPIHPLSSRSNRDLAGDIASLFIATDAIDSRCSQGSAVYQAARILRPTCAEAIAVLSSIPDLLEGDRVNGELVLRTLFHNALYPEGDDPVARLEQVFWLLDLVLPLSLSETGGDRTQQRFWTQMVIPNVLPELQRFMRALAVDHQVQLVKRLVDLDRGEVALGQWFVDEELKYLVTAIGSVDNPQLDPDRRAVSQAQVSNSFQFLCGLIEATSTGEFFHDRETLDDTSRVLACTLESGIIIPSALDFACILEPHAPLMDQHTQIDLTSILFRGASSRPSLLPHAAAILAHIQQTQTTEVTRVAAELGPTLQHAVEDENWRSYWGPEEPVLHAIMSSLSWLVGQSKIEKLLLPGISESSFMRLLDRVAAAAPNGETMTSEFRAILIPSHDVAMWPLLEDPGIFTLSPDCLGWLLSKPPVTPSTPRLGGESIFKMATLSPITALIGASKISTLTKTYQNNDFRQLSVRQNTSRRPSMHVDDFEQGGAGLASPAAVQPSPAPLVAPDYFQLLSSQKPENE